MIAGIQKCSFIDYPGHISAVVFLQGCNLKCPYCHNPELIARRSSSSPLLTENELIDFLSKRINRLDAVVITGGEPTLDPELPDLIKMIRGLGFLVKLDTNGTRPGVLQRLLGENLLDYIAMDLKDSLQSYTEWLGMKEDPSVLIRSMDLIKSSGVDHELRTTVVLPHHDENRLRRISCLAKGAKRWRLQPFRSPRKDTDSSAYYPPPDGYLERLSTISEN